ncbi:MAG: hypothetical protein ACP5MG_00435 [Verrucomicrobiia bacterium]|jgi:hypothetical protein
MSAISEIIVREYFEIHGFLVRQQRKYIPRTEREDEEMDFLVYNPEPKGAIQSYPIVLDSQSLKAVSCAIVSVKGWHTDLVSPSVIKKMEPDIERFVEKDYRKYYSSFKESVEPMAMIRILVIPSITSNPEQRQKTVELLYKMGIEGVIQFRTILWDLINYVQVNHNYLKSDVLQVIRILKAYDVFKEPQLTLFERRRRGKKAQTNPSKQDTSADGEY